MKFKEIRTCTILILLICILSQNCYRGGAKQQADLPDWATDPRAEKPFFSGVGTADNLDEALGISVARLSEKIDQSIHSYYSSFLIDDPTSSDLRLRGKTKMVHMALSRHAIGNAIVLGRISMIWEEEEYEYGPEISAQESFAYILDYWEDENHYGIEYYSEDKPSWNESWNESWKEVRSINVVEEGLECYDLMKHLEKNGLLIETARDENNHYVFIQPNDSLSSILNRALKARQESKSKERADSAETSWADSVETQFKSVFGDLISFDLQDLRDLSTEQPSTKIDSVEKSERSIQEQEAVPGSSLQEKAREAIDKRIEEFFNRMQQERSRRDEPTEGDDATTS